jgi:small subunit ribosomal protein S2
MGNAVIEAQGGVVEKFEDEPITNPAPRTNRPERTERHDRGERPAYKPRENVKVEPVVEAVKVEPVVEAVKTVKVKPTPKPVVEETKVETKTVEAESVVTDGKLEAMTVAELRALAKERGLTGFSTLKKAELIDALK